jgi:iron complex transport system substrate-binding protein
LPKPRLAFIEWGEPLMSGGNWMPTLIEIAGGNNLFGKSGGKSEVLAWSELVAADADVIIIAPCGFILEQSLAEHVQLQRNPHWSSLKAVREQRVYCADGSAFFNRPGPRLVETAEILAEALHPTVFEFGHHGRGWRHPK